MEKVVVTRRRRVPPSSGRIFVSLSGNVLKAEQDIRQQMAAQEIRELQRARAQCSLLDSLELLIRMMDESGCERKAQQTRQEQESLYEDLLRASANVFLPLFEGFVVSKNTQSVKLRERRRLQGAISAARDGNIICHVVLKSKHSTTLWKVNTAIVLKNLGNALSELDRDKEATSALIESVDLLEHCVAEIDPAEPIYPMVHPMLATSLNDLANAAADRGHKSDARKLFSRAIDIRKRLAKEDQVQHLPDLARSMGDKAALIDELADTDELAESLTLTLDAVDLCEQFIQTGANRDVNADRQSFKHLHARLVTNLGRLLGTCGKLDESAKTLRKANNLLQDLVRIDWRSNLDLLGRANEFLADTLATLGHDDEAVMHMLSAHSMYLRYFTVDSDSAIASYLRCTNKAMDLLNNNGLQHQAAELGAAALELAAVRWYEKGALGRSRIQALNVLAERLEVLATNLALLASANAVSLSRDLVSKAGGVAERLDLVDSLTRQAMLLAGLCRRDEAITVAGQALEVHAQVESSDPTDEAHALTGLNLAVVLNQLGQQNEALDLVSRAIGELSAFDDVIARSMALDLKGTILFDLAQRTEAMECKRLAVTSIKGARNCLMERAVLLGNVGYTLVRCGDFEGGLSAIAEANDLRSEVDDRATRLELIANGAYNQAVALASLNRTAEAMKAADHAVKSYRQLFRLNSRRFALFLCVSLAELGKHRIALGHRTEAYEVLRESSVMALRLVGVDPQWWTIACRDLIEALDESDDLRNWHIPMLRRLTEDREVAPDIEVAGIYLDLQRRAAIRVWDLMSTLPATGELLDDGLAALVAALQSPDLARWIEARATPGGPLSRLAEIKQQIMETELRLALLSRSEPADGKGALRGRAPAKITPQQGVMFKSNEVEADLRDSARRLRQAYRDEKCRLAGKYPEFAAAFAPPGPTALRLSASHGQGDALLFMLELIEGRSVAALMHVDGRPTQLLEPTGLYELAADASAYDPAAGRRYGVRRGGPSEQASEETVVSDAAAPQSIAERFGPLMSERFWVPLQAALREMPVRRLHVLPHGAAQQLPLALRGERDCPGLQLLAWPGLPYLRLAASTESASSTGPWFIGHDCAWDSTKPLPMVAVEATLLAHLLQRYRHQVRPIRQATQFDCPAAALVICCHGSAERTQFDHSLHFGAQALTVRDIVLRQLGPPLVLLPACHVGRTDEDSAGNALGVAASFMLSGTRVVVASSKEVSDLLQPWHSTLTVWHALQGLPHHEAANLARAQFAEMMFPEAYRSWLQDALPQALATILPGGEEYKAAKGPAAMEALDNVVRSWPWQGDAEGLYSGERRRREQALQSIVQGVLLPRPQNAQTLAADLREMAAFVFVYGV